jgi:hypothetical protein
MAGEVVLMVVQRLTAPYRGVVLVHGSDKDLASGSGQVARWTTWADNAKGRPAQSGIESWACEERARHRMYPGARRGRRQGIRTAVVVLFQLGGGR